jgi:hypothetical protein
LSGCRGNCSFALVFQHLLKVSYRELVVLRFLRPAVSIYVDVRRSALSRFLATRRQRWIISADDTVCFTVLLFAGGGDCLRALALPPIAVALSGLVTVFFYLSAVVLCLYVPARLVEYAAGDQ